MPNLKLSDFNRDYLAVHTAKEDLFWTTYMGVEKDSEKLAEAEKAYKKFISDPLKTTQVREALQSTPAHDETSRQGLEGWEKFFAANIMENPAASRLQSDLIELEATLFQKKAQLNLTFRDSLGNEKQGSINVLSANLSSSADETTRKTSHDALLTLEQWVLGSGFIDIIKKRNELARALGKRNYFEYGVYKNESLTVPELFQILEEFEVLTRESCFTQLKHLAESRGPSAILPSNLRFAVAGDVNQKLDPYLPFSKSLERWSRSFSRLGVRYRGARLSLDLIERKGKYDNGFMHGPGPCFFEQGQWQPARINFTSNATPNQVGSGFSGLSTLFHEGGHAAHFSNITMNAPCFSQEYPPTSMAYAETQSMFLDSLIGDGDWLKLYARDPAGREMPDELIHEYVTAGQPFRSFQERNILVVPVFERRLYEMAESELTPESITRLARQCEKEILGVDCSPRPLLGIPHLLSAQSACSYQGYLLAHMAVYQTRGYFLRKYGYLTDNPAIGPEIEKHYWNPGNSIRHSDSIRALTGQALSGQDLAAQCNLPAEDLWHNTQAAIEKAMKRKLPSENAPELNAEIRIVHGADEIASNRKSMASMWREFENWVDHHFPRLST